MKIANKEYVDMFYPMFFLGKEVIDYIVRLIDLHIFFNPVKCLPDQENFGTAKQFINAGFFFSPFFYQNIDFNYFVSQKMQHF